MAQIIKSEAYAKVAGQLFEIGAQLRQPDGYPFDSVRLERHLDAALEGRFWIPEETRGGVYVVRLGGSETTDSIVADLGFSADKQVTQENFPIEPRQEEEEVEIEAVNVDFEFDFEEGLAILRKKKLHRPTYEEAIRFADQFGVTTISPKTELLFFHEPWMGDKGGVGRVLAVDRRPRCRDLYLRGINSIFFGEGSMLAGVRRRRKI